MKSYIRIERTNATPRTEFIYIMNRNGRTVDTTSQEGRDATSGANTMKNQLNNHMTI